MTKIKEAWSSRARSKTWAFDVQLGEKRYRRIGFHSQEDAEIALSDVENAPLAGTAIKIGSIGAIAELAVCVDLLHQGFDVFRSVSINAACDLIAANLDGQLCRIEVKSAVVRRGSVRFKRHRFDRSKHDVLALVFLKEREIEYSPSLSQWFQRQSENKAS